MFAWGGGGGGAYYVSCQKRLNNVNKIWHWGFIFKCFIQTINQSCFGTSERPTVNSALISTSLAAQY